MISKQDIYIRLVDLARRMPALSSGQLSSADREWIGSVTALIEAAGNFTDGVMAKLSAQNLSGVLREHNAETIEHTLRHTIARLELELPVSDHMSVRLATGESFSNLAAVADVLASAKSGVLLVDPYVDGTVLTKFITWVREGVDVRLLGDEKNEQPTLLPAVIAWREQHAERRPLVARLTERGALHNRCLIVDQAIVWRLGQSFKDLANRSPDALERMDKAIAQAEIDYYEERWSRAQDVQGRALGSTTGA